MAEDIVNSEDPIWQYKDMMRGFLEKRPSGLRKKISDEIGTNRSFVSQITNPKYAIPIPSHYVHSIMDICHLSPIERTAFLEAYLLAHPGQTELMNVQSLNDETTFKIDLAEIKDEQTRGLVRQTLKNMAETLIAVAQRDKE